MRPPTEPLRFRAPSPPDEVFVATLARASFSAWSRDPARNVARMLRSSSAAGEIASLGGERVGFYVLDVNRLSKPYGPFESPAIAHLDAIAVASSFSRRGIGRALLRRAEQVARERGAVVMTLMTAVGNARARRMFQRFGFMPVLKIEGAYESGEAGIQMFKLVAGFESYDRPPTMH
ncbi:MAG: GNAT family N-acetyltransferase [Polyangiaceae bacterium]